VRPLEIIQAAFTRSRGRLRTIRTSVFLAFVATVLISGSLALYGIQSIRGAGELVRKTYDQSLMSINYSRAAAADFAEMRANFARLWITEDVGARAQLNQRFSKLEKSLSEDLNIAALRSPSERAKATAEKVAAAARRWTAASHELLDETKLGTSWEELDHLAKNVDDEIDLLVNYTAGDAFLYRQSASATVDRDIKLNIASAFIALTLSGLVGWALTRRMVKPVAAASHVAKCIASGKLDVEIPSGSSDELGELLSSMQVMRDNIAEMMQREVTLRQSAQIRLAEAAESLREAIIVVDADNRIALANAQAANFLAVPADALKAGVAVAEIKSGVREEILLPETEAKRDEVSFHRDIRSADGRWFRISRNKTSEGGFIVLCSDVTTSKLQEARLHGSKLRLDAALESMSQGLCLFAADNRLQLVNRRFAEIFGLDPARIRPGMTLQEISLTHTHGGTANCALSILKGDGGLNVKLAADTQYHELDDGRVIAAVYNRTKDGGWVATFEDATERRKAESRIMHMARHDTLTDLPNRLLFHEHMGEALARGRDLAVHFIDLDRFKSVNDTLGHPVGDALLCAMASRIRSALEAGDVIARLGGDEFAILQFEASPSSASELAQQIIDLAAEPFDIMHHQVVIGASIGIALAPSDGRDVDQLLRNSDMALYRAKSAGRGCYHFFQPEMDDQIQTRHALERDLRNAIRNGELEVHYQPIASVREEKLRGFEALARWKHPTRGYVSPEIFIPLAEETGLINSLGDWVLRKACRDAVSWPSSLSVAVNLSAVQFRNATLPLLIASTLGETGLASHRLELEITESVFLKNDRTNLNMLHQIRGLGVRISMDDFGTGYSSLSYLRSFPFDKIKIDRSFVAELGKGDDGLAIIKAVGQLGKSLGMITLAEGVETEAQLELLRNEGIVEAQGYLLGKPVPLAEVGEVIDRLRSRLAA